MTTKFFLLLLLVLSGICGLAHGLKCWKCESDRNWEGCRLLQTEDCMLRNAKCGSFYTKQGAVETYRRDCFTEDYCNAKPQCTEQFSKCAIDCCSGNACNTGTSKSASLLPCIILLFSSALLAFLIL